MPFSRIATFIAPVLLCFIAFGCDSTEEACVTDADCADLTCEAGEEPVCVLEDENVCECVGGGGTGGSAGSGGMAGSGGTGGSAGSGGVGGTGGAGGAGGASGTGGTGATGGGASDPCDADLPVDAPAITTRPVLVPTAGSPGTTVALEVSVNGFTRQLDWVFLRPEGGADAGRGGITTSGGAATVTFRFDIDDISPGETVLQLFLRGSDPELVIAYNSANCDGPMDVIVAFDQSIGPDVPLPGCDSVCLDVLD
ncbi:MAG: hypothetical protein AAF500_20400 [Myxococcota bacterium]